MISGDTIAAISSAVGAGARMIVRASGPAVRGIHTRLTDTADFPPGSARCTYLSFAGIVVPAWVYLFGTPRSVTGEDVVELHIPGNPLLAGMLLDELIRLGARQAEAGEFAARAYFNGRIDLAEAEGIAATIAAQSQRELTAARQLMAGELARRLGPVLDLIFQTLGLVEVGIDFSEEDISLLSKSQIVNRIDSAQAALTALLSESARFERLFHEPHIVLVGRPNAGKSTLLNALARQERAVVSPQPGTTRDVIWAEVHLRRGMVRIVDVAGLDEAREDEVIAQSMQNRASQTMQQADVLVLVRDCTDTRPEPVLSRQPDLRVISKIDLRLDRSRGQGSEVGVSASSGLGLDDLRDRLDELAFGQAGGGAALALNARHVQAIDEALQALARAGSCATAAGAEVLAMELRESLDAIGSVLGRVTPDDVLGRIFSTFCIGK